MKHFLFTIMIIFFAVSAQASDVGVSISVGQPGFYGRIDIGGFPHPKLIYARPVVIQAGPVSVVLDPIYMHIPPGHVKNWSKQCAKYNACNRPVYFVQDRWYNDVYVPHYQKHYGRNHGRDHDRDHDRKHDRNHDDDHDDGHHERGGHHDDDDDD